MSNGAGLVRFLIKRRIVDAADIVDDGLRLYSDSRERFVVSTIEFNAGGRRLLAKQARSRDTRASVHQETLAYRRIHRDDRLAALAPALVGFDAGRGILLLEMIEDALPFNQLAPQQQATGLLGEALGLLHSLTIDSKADIVQADAPWIFSCLSTKPSWQPPQLDAILQQAPNPDLITTMIDRMRPLWHPACLIHGDLKWEHCLYRADDRPRDPVLIDWELASFGDPAWDVASLISEILLDARDRGGGDSVSPQLQQYGPMDHFLHSYRSLYPIDLGFLERTALFTAARLFQTSLESAAGYGAAIIPEMNSTLQMATAILDDPDAFARRLYH